MRRTIVFETLVAILIHLKFHNTRYLLVQLDDEVTNKGEDRSFSRATQMIKLHKKGRLCENIVQLMYLVSNDIKYETC